MPAAALALTASPELAEELSRLAAAAGLDLRVVPGAPAPATWADAALVLVGNDLATGLVGVVPGRRRGVVLVGRGELGATCLEAGLALGADAALRLPADEAVLLDRLAVAVDGGDAAALGRLVAVLPGCGGAGASTFTLALAVAAQRSGRRVVVLDGDPLGGGLDLLVGCEAVPGLRWPDLGHTRGRVSAAALRAALLDTGWGGLLSWDRRSAPPIPQDVGASILTAARRAADVVVVDLARPVDGFGQVVSAAADAIVLVAPARVRAVPAAGRVLDGLPTAVGLRHCAVRVPVGSVLAPERVASHLGLPLLTWWRDDPGLAARTDRGEPPGRRGRLAAAARTAVRELLTEPTGRQLAA